MSRGSSGSAPDVRRWLAAFFDSGITQFDLANNYGPPYGAAEANGLLP
jgi:L-glyceraldehyde 3-phosphate reductase